MRKRLVFLCAILIFFSFSSPTYAQSVAELQAQLNALIAQVAALQQLLAQQSATPTYSPPIVTQPVASVPGGACPVLFRALRKGMSGEDVSSLQQFLYARGLLSSVPTGFFGALTEAAVQQFQATNGIVSSGTPETTGFGSVGPGTRAAIARLCGGGSVSTPYNPYSTHSYCTLNGITLNSGESRAFFTSPTVSSGEQCLGQVRYCNNGVLAGGAQYSYPTCTSAPSTSCYVNGKYVASGVTQSYYSRSSVSYDQRCSDFREDRTCTNGTLSGSTSHIYSSCTIEEGNDCFVGAETIAHGTSRTMYSQTNAPYGSSCSTYSALRECRNGTLLGSSAYSNLSCIAASTSSCTLDGVTISNNISREFYNTAVVPYGETCTGKKQARLCTLGVLSGDASYEHATCAVAGPGSCTLDGATVAHGAAKTFYSSQTVLFGQTCASKALSRTCTNGALSGSTDFKYATCNVGSPSSCSLDGVVVAHGASRVFYSTSTVAFGTTCTPYGQTRTCSNGVLSGSATNSKASCSVGSAPGPSCSLSTIATEYLPNQQVGFKWTATNSTGGSLLGVAIPAASIANGSRTNAISYGTSGDKTVAMSVTGSQGTSAQCSTIVKVQDVLPPACTLSARKGTTNFGSAITVNYVDQIQLVWTSERASDYATSSSIVGPGATTSVNISSGSVTLTPRATSYTYMFNNAGGSRACSVAVTFNPPTCTTPVSNKATYVYGDPVTLTYSSTNADYATATSSDHLPASGSVTIPAITDTTTYTFTFNGLGGQKTCSKTVTVTKPLSVSSPTGGTFQKGNEVVVSWAYPGAAATAGVYLALVDTAGNTVSTSTIATQLNTTGSYGWTIPQALGSTQLASGQYKVRAIAYTPKSACSGSSCGSHTVLARADSGVFSISTTASLESQLAAAVMALQKILELYNALVR